MSDAVSLIQNLKRLYDRLHCRWPSSAQASDSDRQSFLFRNDDVSWDTSLESLTRFCGIFHKYGFSQLHGITLRGCTNTTHLFGSTPAEYEGYDTIAHLDNALIRRLSEGKCLEDCNDLVAYLNAIPDPIALHGLYHTDYAKMTAEEQARDLHQGLVLLERLFPRKKAIYFIPPFNRRNADTYRICENLGLTVLADEGVHLESVIKHLQLKRKTWYRYHHHRFYPESQFSYYDLSLDLLDHALGKEVLK